MKRKLMLMMGLLIVAFTFLLGCATVSPAAHADKLAFLKEKSVDGTIVLTNFQAIKQAYLTKEIPKAWTNFENDFAGRAFDLEKAGLATPLNILKLSQQYEKERTAKQAQIDAEIARWDKVSFQIAELGAGYEALFQVEKMEKSANLEMLEYTTAKTLESMVYLTTKAIEFQEEADALAAQKAAQEALEDAEENQEEEDTDKKPDPKPTPIP